MQPVDRHLYFLFACFGWLSIKRVCVLFLSEWVEEVQTRSPLILLWGSKGGLDHFGKMSWWFLWRASCWAIVLRSWLKWGHPPLYLHGSTCISVSEQQEDREGKNELFSNLFFFSFAGLKWVQHRKWIWNKLIRSSYLLLTCMLTWTWSNYYKTRWEWITLTLFSLFVTVTQPYWPDVSLFLTAKTKKQPGRRNRIYPWFHSSHCDLCHSPKTVTVTSSSWLWSCLPGDCTYGSVRWFTGGATWEASCSISAGRTLWSTQCETRKGQFAWFLWVTLNLGPRWTSDPKRGLTNLQTVGSCWDSYTLDVQIHECRICWKW